MSGGIGKLSQADNVEDHRARTVIVASKHARKPGFACIRLLCGDLLSVEIHYRVLLLAYAAFEDHIIRLLSSHVFSGFATMYPPANRIEG